MSTQSSTSPASSSSSSSPSTSRACSTAASAPHRAAHRHLQRLRELRRADAQHDRPARAHRRGGPGGRPGGGAARHLPHVARRARGARTRGRRTVIAYKFLRDGRVGPFSHVTWPEPQAAEPWVQRRGAGGVCSQHVHACRVGDLPEWLDSELWRVELDGDVAVDCGKLVAARGRLLARVDAWGPGAAADFAEACAARAGGCRTGRRGSGLPRGRRDERRGRARQPAGRARPRRGGRVHRRACGGARGRRCEPAKPVSPASAPGRRSGSPSASDLAG